jgi:hypothetical protein
MLPAPREDALSEVIGFILILALIAGLASLYITYVVPAQGREGEILHMAEINDQFLGYKTGVDSLWLNFQANVPISRTFTLGTLTGLTQGSFVIPLFQAYPSSGTMVVNGRVETLTIKGDALVQGFPGNSAPNMTPIRYEPNHIYVQMMSTNVSKLGGLTLTPSSGSWKILLNVTTVGLPGQVTVSTVGTIPTFTGQGASDIKYWIENYLIPWGNTVNTTVIGAAAYSQSLTITIFKHGNTTVTELPVSTNMKSNQWYTIDLLDDAYGLEKDLNLPFNLVEPFNSTSNWIQYRYPVSVGYVGQSINQSHPMGSLGYYSSNKYWIQQNYYYQQGGVILEQPGEGMVMRVMPLISITNQNGIPSVRIVDITISGSGNVGGGSPVQVITSLDSVSRNTLGGYTLAQGVPNARNVSITINAQDEPSAKMWNQTFAGIKRSADPGIRNWISNTQTGNRAILSINNPIPGSSEHDIILEYSLVNLSAELQPVAV